MEKVQGRHKVSLCSQCQRRKTIGGCTFSIVQDDGTFKMCGAPICLECRFHNFGSAFTIRCQKFTKDFYRAAKAKESLQLPPAAGKGDGTPITPKIGNKRLNESSINDDGLGVAVGRTSAAIYSSSDESDDSLNYNPFSANPHRKSDLSSTKQDSTLPGKLSNQKTGQNDMSSSISNKKIQRTQRKAGPSAGSDNQSASSSTLDLTMTNYEVDYLIGKPVAFNVNSNIGKAICNGFKRYLYVLLIMRGITW